MHVRDGAAGRNALESCMVLKLSDPLLSDVKWGGGLRGACASGACMCGSS